MSWRGLSTKAKRLVIGVVVLLFLAVVVWAPRLATPILRSRLQAMISEQLNAELQMDALSYHPPYGITVRGARIVTPSPDGPGAPPVVLLQMRQLDLTLAKLPIGSGPLVIKNLVVHQPSVHLIQTAGGLLGRRTLVKQHKETPGSHK